MVAEVSGRGGCSHSGKQEEEWRTHRVADRKWIGEVHNTVDRKQSGGAHNTVHRKQSGGAHNTVDKEAEWRSTQHSAQAVSYTNITQPTICSL